MYLCAADPLVTPRCRIQSSFEVLNRLGPNLKNRIYVVFVNDMGMEETGIDAGGLFKELWTSLAAIAFNPAYGFFKVRARTWWRLNAQSRVCLRPALRGGSMCGRGTVLLLECAVEDGTRVSIVSRTRAPDAVADDVTEPAVPQPARIHRCWHGRHGAVRVPGSGAGQGAV